MANEASTYTDSPHEDPSAAPAQNEIHDDVGNEKQTSPISAPYQFLNLPVEIRLQIYRYLAPNTIERPYRDDGRPCCPSILQTNRTIYQEAMGEWYSLVSHKGVIGLGDLLLFNQPVGSTDFPSKFRYRPDNIPSSFRAIKSLDLTVRLEKVCRPRLDLGHPPHVIVQQLLQACFPPQSADLGKLQRLHVRLAWNRVFFLAYSEKSNQLEQALESNLSAIRNLHGLVEVRFSIHNGAVAYQTMDIPWKREFIATLLAYSRKLEKSLSNIPITSVAF